MTYLLLYGLLLWSVAGVLLGLLLYVTADVEYEGEAL